MKKVLISAALALILSATAMPLGAEAATQYYTVTSRNTTWRYVKRYQPKFNWYKTNNNTVVTSQPKQETNQSKPADEQQNVQTPSNTTQTTQNNSSTQTSQTDTQQRAYEKEVVRLVNIEREKNGLKPLKENEELSRVARFKSDDMKDQGYFSHTSPTYGSPFDMMKNFGIKYSYAGENIAKGQRTPEEVVRAWMNSTGHRKNILNVNYTEIGVGYTKDVKGTAYWTQMFMKPQQ
ncbi:CAP domain-containing protein [Anaerophilus nitritogenes]|uniref:CAP domain-containing protein n=1 Tax=Anaerophilus nitritogenes TaxID=2498136 RepID=UPI00101C02FF